MALKRRTLLATAAALAATLAGCAQFNYAGPDSPVALSVVAPMEPRPRVALVLSSGGPRGYAHIGVMRVLEEAGIEIDLVVGSSVGSLLGAFWADGRTAAEIDALSQDGGPLTLFDLSPFADRGWIHGQRLQDYVNTRLVHPSIEDMPRRLVVRCNPARRQAAGVLHPGQRRGGGAGIQRGPGHPVAGGHRRHRIRRRRRIAAAGGAGRAPGRGTLRDRRRRHTPR